jgi:hypothetical protein
MVNDDIVDCKAYITYDGSASTTSQIYGLVGEHKPGWDIGASAYDNNSVSRCIAKMIATGTFAKIGGLAGDAPSNLNNLNTSFKENVVECDINAIANEFVGLVYNYGEVRNNYVKGSVSGYIGKFSGLLNHYNNAWQNSVLKNYSAITYQNSYPSHISYPLIAEDMGSYPDTLSFYDSSKYGLPSNCPSARTTEQMITQSTYELFNHYKFTVSKTNIQNVTQDNVYFEYWQVSLYSGLSLVGSFVYIVKTILDTNYIDHNPDPLAGALFIDRGLRGVGKPDNFVFIGINGVWQQTSFDSALNSLLPSGRDGDLIDDIDLFTIYRVDGGNGKYTSKLKC